MSYDKKYPRLSTTVAGRKLNTKSGPTSAEFVEDSDIEANSDDASDSSTKQSLKRKATEISRSSHTKKSNSTGDPQDHAATKKTNGKVNGSSGKKAQDNKAWLSNLSGSESDEGSSNDSSDDDSPANVTESQSGSQIQTQHTNSKLTSDSEDDDRNDTNSEDEDSDSSPESTASSEAAPVQAEVVIVPPRTNGTTTASFEAPEGFVTPSISTSATTNIRHLFSAENLKGKEIWHLTVPSSLSIDEIHKFTKADMISRKSVLNHRGTDYGFNVEHGKGVTSKVLIPARNGSKYEPVTAPIHQTLHLRQITKIPSVKSRPNSETTGTISGARKPVLQQPKGLKLGYPPIGDVDFDDDRRVAVKRAKQRIDNSKLEQAEPLPVAKKSKKMHASSLDPQETTEWVDPEAYNAPVVVGSASQHTIEFPPEPNPSMDTTMINGIEEGHASMKDPEAKARRKAEKAARRKAARQEADKARKQAGTVEN